MKLNGRLELTWTGKDERNKIERRLLIEDKNKSYGDPCSKNMLIHGDNLLALKTLERDYSRKVKCIYIDPPYNTGAAFEHYNDKLEHSIWLNLMYQRIEILYNLLSDDGFLCCEIDDSESHYLKVIFDEIFGRDNYLTTLYVRVRYPEKTLKEDMNFHKEIEQIFVYRKSTMSSPNLKYEKIGFEKFNFYIKELSIPSKTIELGGKKVEVFSADSYEIYEGEGTENGRKEIWASGTILDGNSSGRFFRDYLTGRYEQDGYGVLYKVYGIGDDKFDYRYFSGPKKVGATKGKYYQGVPLDKLNSVEMTKKVPINGFYDFAGSFGNCRLEGGTSFRGGKKPEKLVSMILEMFSNEGDLVLDSFLGSGTTCAVAHKMNRKWIGIELGEHAYSLCKKRIDSIIDGNDYTGVTKDFNWCGGGGYHFYELSEPLFVKHSIIGIYQFNKSFDICMIRNAICNIEGYTYEEHGLIHGYSSEKHYIHITKDYVNGEYINEFINLLAEDESISIYTLKYQPDMRLPDNIEIIDIMKCVLPKCIDEKEVE